MSNSTRSEAGAVGGRGLKAASVLVLVLLISSLVTSANAYQRPGVTELVSVPIADELIPDEIRGIFSEGDSGLPSRVDVSSNGRFVVWETAADNMVENDTNQSTDVFLRDRKRGETVRVSVSSGGMQQTEVCPLAPEEIDPDNPEPLVNRARPSISANGRWIAFTSCSSNLVPGDTNLAQDVFLHDTVKRTTELVSLSQNGSQAGGPPPWHLRSMTSSNSISANGKVIAFQSTASNLVPDDTNDAWDAFVRDLRKDTTERVSVTSEGQQANPTPEQQSSGSGISGPQGVAISADGMHVAFESAATNLWGEDTERYQDCYAHSRASGKTVLASRSRTLSGGQEDVGAATGCAISGDGRLVAFVSDNATLIPNDTNKTECALGPGAHDIFVFDTKTERTRRASVSSEGFQGCDNGTYGGVDISANGRFVSFASRSAIFSEADSKPSADPTTTLWPGYSTHNDVFVHDLLSGATELASLSTDGTANEDGQSNTSAISADGRYVAFTSYGTFNGERQSNGFWIRERGPAVGFGGMQSAKASVRGQGDICFESACLSPMGTYIARDGVDSDQALAPADLQETTVSYRPTLGDLFVVNEVQRMFSFGPQGSTLGSTGLIHGFRFEVGGESYEARASSEAGGRYALFRCGGPGACTSIGALQGGFGTTGDRVVMSLPMNLLGIEDGATLRALSSYTAIGTLETGPLRITDQIDLIAGTSSG